MDHGDGDGVDGDAVGGWRSLPEVILVAFPSPIFSSGSRQTLCFDVFDISTASLHDPQGDPFYSRF
jgi:hypothetical protein